MTEVGGFLSVLTLLNFLWVFSYDAREEDDEGEGNEREESGTRQCMLI